MACPLAMQHRPGLYACSSRAVPLVVLVRLLVVRSAESVALQAVAKGMLPCMHHGRAGTSPAAGTDLAC
jgi:hypothetical protein